MKAKTAAEGFVITLPVRCVATHAVVLSPAAVMLDPAGPVNIRNAVRWAWSLTLGFRGPLEGESFGAKSDVREQVEIFVVLIAASFTLAQQLFRFHKFNPLDPLNHFVAQLILHAKAERGSVD